MSTIISAIRLLAGGFWIVIAILLGFIAKQIHNFGEWIQGSG